jgi:hypothetical protein
MGNIGLKCRKSVLDLDMLRYSLSCDGYHNTSKERALVITCLDQVPDKIPVTINGVLKYLTYYDIGIELGFSIGYNILPSYSNMGYNGFKGW